MADSEVVGPASRSPLRIGEWSVEPSLNQLRRGEEVVRLEPKSIEVLLALAARPGVVLTRDELLAAAWPGVIVGDDALTQAVIKLRRALGDTAREPRYIETIAKRGYRLVAEVVRGDASPAARAPVARGRRGRPALLALTALAVVAVLALGWLLRARTDDAAAGDGLAMLARGLEQLAGQPTIAVRPFEAIGGDAQPAVVAAGLTSDLITDLSNVPGLTVLGGSRPVGEPAPGSTALPAHYVLTGTVRRQADRLRVNVQLTDARADSQVWSERFEPVVEDLFSMQDEIVRRLLTVLPVKISEAERARVARRYTRNLEAYELFHRGLQAMGARERAQNQQARDLYWRAIALDPAFARAYAGIAMTHAQDYRQLWVDDGASALAQAIETAERAVKIDADSAEALWVLAFVRAHERRHDEGLALLREALKRSPSYADAYFLTGLMLMESGRPRDALTWMQAAMRLVPNPGSIHHFGFGQAYYFAGDPERARVNLEAALVRNPAHAEAHLYLAAVLVELGRMEQAAWHVGEMKGLRPAFRGDVWLERHPVVDSRQRERLIDVLDRLGLRR